MSDTQRGELFDPEAEGAYEPTGVFASDEIKAALGTYLQDELKDVIDGPERKELEEKWESWRRHRVAKPKEAVKNTPWPGASNVATPATGSNTNGIYARVKSHIKKRIPLITIETDHRAFQGHAHAMARFVNRLMESPLHINFNKEFNPICYDTVSLGTQFVEIPWKTRRWQFKRTGGTGGEEQVDKVVYDGPVIEAPRIEDFVTRVHWWDIQSAPWCAFRSRWFRYEIDQQAALGYFENVEALDQVENPDLEKNLKLDQERLGLKAVLSDANKEYELFRVYVYWDADGNGITEDLILWFERETGTILRAEFNELGRRPIVKFPYFSMPKMLYALGVGWMSEAMQEEIDTLHNIRINSSHLSSVQMTLSRKGSGLPKRFLISPAANHEVDDPEKDVRPITFPDVSQATLGAEMVAKQYLDRFSGAGEAGMGLSDTQAKTRATAGGTMFLAQRSDSIQMSIIEDIEVAISEVALFVVMQLVANGERAKQFLLPFADPADMKLIEEVLAMKVEDVPLRFKFLVKVTEEEKTEDAKRQGILMLTQLYTMFGKEMTENIMMITNPQVPPPIKEFLTRIYVGRVKLMDEALKMFGEPSTASYLPYTRDLEFMLQMLDVMKEQQVGQAAGGMNGGGMEGAGPGGAGPGQAPGMEAGGGLGMVPGAGPVPQAPVGGEVPPMG